MWCVFGCLILYVMVISQAHINIYVVQNWLFWHEYTDGGASHQHVYVHSYKLTYCNKAMCFLFKLNYFRDTFLLVRVCQTVCFPHKTSVHACFSLYCTVPAQQPLYRSLSTSNSFHLFSFTVVKGKIKKAQWESQTEWERKGEHPVSESLPKNNAVCFSAEAVCRRHYVMCYACEGEKLL